MHNNLNDHLIIVKMFLVYANKQDTNDLNKTLKKHYYYFTKIDSEFIEIKKRYQIDDGSKSQFLARQNGLTEVLRYWYCGTG